MTSFENMQITPPTIITIFGATGDLSTQKLLPSLFDLFQKKYLPSQFKIVGFSRQEISNTDYQKYARKAILAKKNPTTEEELNQFLSHVSYAQGFFDTLESYSRLLSTLGEREQEIGQCTNKLFYLAVPPVYYKSIFENLSESGLMKPCSEETGWTRILVEKPFGNNITTAQELDAILGKLFKEEQVFRIDHYLAKEVLQDILMFRFSNLIFEPLWSNHFIEKIELNLFEKRGVEGRGAFFDETGALRDVGQNHLLQMLAFVATEDPIELDAEHVRAERTRVLKALRPMTKETIGEHVVRGQYEGYLDVPKVSADSQTETYFKIKAFVDNERWAGVPFLIESGKALTENKAEIKVYFKNTVSCLCSPEEKIPRQNVLTFRIQPDEGTSVLFWAKKPGLSLDLEPRELSFSYKSSADPTPLADAYEKVLFDGILGDQMLFTSTEEVSATWHFITPILDLWKDIPLHRYKMGSSGPEITL